MTSQQRNQLRRFVLDRNTALSVGAGFSVTSPESTRRALESSRPGLRVRRLPQQALFQIDRRTYEWQYPGTLWSCTQICRAEARP